MIRNGFILTSLFILIPFVLFSQNNSKNILVEYDIYFNIGVSIEKSGVLVSNGSSSFFRQGTNINVNEEENFSKDEFGNFYTDAQKENLDIHIKEDSLITITHLGNKFYKVYEDLPRIEWTLNNSKARTINGFKSLQATGTFRGRDYIAWYTPEIPLNLGPWKFSNLPGLILEISDKNKQFQWFVKEINYPYNQKVTSFASSNEEFKEVSLKKYVGIFEKYLEERQSKQASRAPKGVKLVSSKSSRGIELIYEWEKE